ncbi:MAG: Rrf2 family transcriptional regulator [Acidimicrobiia bacterium]
MYISARADYVTRALLVLAAAPDGGPVTAASIAEQQHMPQKFVENSLVDLKKSGLVSSVRGNAGGFKLARPAAEITVADIIRAVDGPLAEIRGERPETMVYEGPAEHLQHVWVAVRASLRAVLEHVTLEQIVGGELPPPTTQFSDDPDAWIRRV